MRIHPEKITQLTEITLEDVLEHHIIEWQRPNDNLYTLNDYIDPKDCKKFILKPDSFHISVTKFKNHMADRECIAYITRVSTDNISIIFGFKKESDAVYFKLMLG